MRIALVAPLISAVREPHIGGVATLLTDLAHGIQEAGHQVHLFAASGSQVPGLNVVDTGVRASTLRETLFRPLEGPVPEYVRSQRTEVARSAFQKVYEMVAAGSYQVVHNHSFDAAAIEAAAEVSCPVVHTLHLPFDPDVSAAINAAQALPRPPVIAAVSRSQMLGWQHHNNVDVLLPAGIPVSRIPWSGDAEGGLLVAGRISPEKGVLDAIRIARSCGRSLTIAGNRYDPGYAALVEEEIGETGDVRVVGSLARSNLWQLMAHSSVLLFPIRWEEPFGLVTAEAQAAGCPVVGYRRGALVDVIEEGVTGIAVDPGDLAAAATAVERALSFDRMGCRLHAERNLDIARGLEAHLVLYHRLAGGDRRSG